MKPLFNSVILACGLSVSGFAASQTISLDEHYADYFTGNDNTRVAPVRVSSITQTAVTNTCENHYAEYIK